MATKYLLQNLEGETIKETSKKQSAIAAAEKVSLPFYRVVTSTGTVVHEVVPAEHTNQIDLGAPNWEEPEEDLIGTVEPTPEPEAPKTDAKAERKIRLANSDANRDFLGNYSIAMAPFAQTIAEAFGGIETEVENLPNSLTRRVHFYGTVANVKAFLKVLDPLAVQVIEDLRVWQKANIEKRRGLTDMQKYLQHREFIAKASKKHAKEVRAAH